MEQQPFASLHYIPRYILASILHKGHVTGFAPLAKQRNDRQRQLTVGT